MSSISTQLLFEIAANTAQFKSALDEANSKLGGFGESFNKLKEIAIGAFEFAAVAEGAKKLFEFSQAIGEVTNKVASLSELGGKDLVDLTASIKSTSDTFGVDFNETLKTTNTLSKQMGISFQDAAKLIQQGTALNETNSQDFLATVKEFSPQFKTMGLNASETLALISKSFKAGIGTSGVEAITKAHKALEELKQPAVDSLRAIGINADELVLRIHQGSITEFEAIQLISEKMKGFGENSHEVGNILVNVFGKAGVKAGAQYVESLAEAKTSMADLVAETGEAEKANLRLAEANEDLDKIWVQMFGGSATEWTDLKATLTEIAVDSLVWIRDKTIDLINYFIELYNNSIIFRAIVQDIKLAFENLWEIVKFFATNLIDVFSNAGDIIKAVFTGNFKAIPELYENAIKKIASSSIELGKNVANNFIDGVKATMSSKKIELIKLDDVSKQGTQAGKTYAESFGEAFLDGSGKSVKKDTPKAKKLDLQIKTNVLQKIADDFKNINLHIQAVNKSAGYMPNTIEKIGDAFKQNIRGTAYPAMQQLGQQIGETMATGKASFADFGNQVLNSVKQMVAASLAQALSATIAANSSYPFPLDVALIAAGTSVVTSAFSAIPGFSDGTSSAPGGLSLVGEKGAELVNLPAGSRVFNNSDTNKMLANSNSGNNSNAIKIYGKVRGSDIYYSQKEVTRQRNNTI